MHPATVMPAGFAPTFDRVYSVPDFSFVFLVEFLPAPFVAEAYPSAYHPPPTNLKEQADIIFFAFFLHLGHLIASVPIGTKLSVMVPSGH
jgi:hypothetical protein